MIKWICVSQYDFPIHHLWNKLKCSVEVTTNSDTLLYMDRELRSATAKDKWYTMVLQPLFPLLLIHKPKMNRFAYWIRSFGYCVGSDPSIKLLGWWILIRDYIGGQWLRMSRWLFLFRWLPRRNSVRRRNIFH